MSEITSLDRENKAFRQLLKRSAFLLLLISLVGGITIFQLFKLSVLDTNLYKTKSEENRIILVPVYSSRGLIKLSDEEIVVENVVSQDLTINPSKTEDLEGTIEKLGETLGFKAVDLIISEQNLKKNNKTYESFVIFENLTYEQVARYVMLKDRWPSVSLKIQLRRFNHHGPLFSHVTGYVGRVNSEELISSEGYTYLPNALIGKTGVEKFYENIFRGGLGYKTIEVDVHGKELRQLDLVSPQKADDIYLSLDKGLQSLARKELRGRKGAIVALDPNTGLIKALVSSPDFNPNVLNKTEPGNIPNILNDDQSPLFNRAISGNYPPASIIKPFIGLLGLKEKAINWNSTIEDKGIFQINGQGRRYRGWKEEGHGKVNLKKAIVESSDVFFYQLATQLTIDSISKFLKKFGFGSRTGIDLYAETKGILPDRKWKLAAIGESWFVGDTINLSIGQGYINSSPLQLAVAMSVIATRGKAYQPRVIERVGNKLINQKLLYEVDLFNQNDWTNLEKAMKSVTSAWNGTAYNLASFGEVAIAGKTGTAQIKSLTDDELTVKEEYEGIRLQEENRDHALFVGYGPLPKPTITVVVIVENGESGSAIAAPIAQRLIDFYVRGNS